MSYYGSSSYNSASLLDPYCAGGSRYHSSGLSDSIFDRKDNYYSSTYSSAYGGHSNNDYASSRPSARPSAFDRYVSYLSDEMTSSSSSAANRRYLHKIQNYRIFPRFICLCLLDCQQVSEYSNKISTCK